MFTAAAALMGVTLLDWLLFLPQSIRWILGAGVYAGVAWVVWSTCLRLIWRIPTAAEMASWVESAEPRLRDELVAAVELGSPESERPWHSIAFRRLLQNDVADKMTDVDVGRLLPWALIQRWVHVALVATILLLVLFAIPGLRFGQRITRALLPLASIERISLTQIEILAPSPADTAVAQGDEVEVLVRIGGPTTDDDVTLETSSDGGPVAEVRMSPVPGGQRSYSATVRIGQDSVRYRIRAGDARTAEHRLMSRRRPQVTSFQKTYRYPEYLSQPTRTETNPSGDLSAVEGTRADLIVSVSQSVSLAQLVIDSPTGKSTLAMSPVETGAGGNTTQVQATVPIDSSGTYRIELVGSETGLANKFSPQYVIQAFPDQPPTISIEEPVSAILVPSDEIVLLAATAEDDHGLSRIEMELRVADDDWSDGIVIESVQDSVTVHVTHLWDIYPFGLQPGNVVSTRLVAVDKKGGRGESQIVRAVISSPRFDPQRWAGLADARSAHDELAKLVTAAIALHGATSKGATSKGATSKGATGKAADPTTAQAAADSAYDYEVQAGTTMAAIEAAMRSAEAGRPSIDLLLTGQAVSQASTVGLRFLRQHLAGGDYTNALKTSKFVGSRITLAAESFDHLLRLSETSAVASDLMSLRRMHRDAVERADRSGSNRIGQRARVIGSEAGLMANRVQAMSAEADANQRKVLEQVRRDLVELETLAAAGDDPLTPQSIRTIGELLQTSLANTISLFQEGLLKSVGPRKRLRDAAGNSDDVVDRAARLTRLASQSNQGEDQPTGGQQAWQLSDAALDAAMSALMTTAALERKRSDSEPGFIADSSRARRAIEAMQLRISVDRAEVPQVCDDLDRLTGAVRVINCVRNTDDLIALVSGVLSRDQRPRADSVAPENAIDAMFNPNEWFCAESLYATLASRLPDTAISRQAAQIIGDSPRRPSYLAVRKEMVARPVLNRAVATKTNELSELLADLKRARELMRDDLQAARRTIAQLSPSLQKILDELARDVQDDVRKLQQAMDENAADAPAVDEDQAATDEAADEQAIEDAIDEQEEQADALAERIRRLREAISDDAAEQSIEDERGRDRIRDDDDALAILDEASEEARRAIEEAAQADDPQQRRDSLAQVARRQAELADQLKQLARHFENLQRDDADESRRQLRDAEARLGLQEEFDAQQRQREELADLASMQPEQAIEALERELETSTWMQRELEELTRQQLADLLARLETAADRPSESQEIADLIRQARQTLEQASRNEQRLGNRQAAEQLAQVAESLGPTPESGDQDAPQQQTTEPIAPNESGPPSEPNASTETIAPDAAESAEEIQAAIDEAARQLDRFLAGQPMSASPEGMQAEPPPQEEAPRDTTSPGSPDGSPEVSRAVAEQLAAALHQLEISAAEEPDDPSSQPNAEAPNAEAPDNPLPPTATRT